MNDIFDKMESDIIGFSATGSLSPRQKQALIQLAHARIAQNPEQAPDILDKTRNYIIGYGTKSGRSQLSALGSLATLAGSVPTPQNVPITRKGTEDEYRNAATPSAMDYAGMKKGGTVPGKGSGDHIPALLEPGEYVIPKKIVERHGKEFFDTLIKGKMKKMNKGGPVERDDTGPDFIALGDALGNMAGVSKLGQRIQQKVQDTANTRVPSNVSLMGTWPNKPITKNPSTNETIVNHPTTGQPAHAYTYNPSLGKPVFRNMEQFSPVLGGYQLFPAGASAPQNTQAQSPLQRPSVFNRGQGSVPKRSKPASGALAEAPPEYVASNPDLVGVIQNGEGVQGIIQTPGGAIATPVAGGNTAENMRDAAAFWHRQGEQDLAANGMPALDYGGYTIPGGLSRKDFIEQRNIALTRPTAPIQRGPGFPEASRATWDKYYKDLGEWDKNRQTAIDNAEKNRQSALELPSKIELNKARAFADYMSGKKSKKEVESAFTKNELKWMDAAKAGMTEKLKSDETTDPAAVYNEIYQGLASGRTTPLKPQSKGEIPKEVW